MLNWTIILLILAASILPAKADIVCVLCFGTDKPQVIDSYCADYQQIMLQQAEAREIAKLSPALKKRIGANDDLYLCRCKGWKNPICAQLNAR